MARKRIDEHTLKVLEFDQVRRILAGYASSSLGRRAALELYPSVDLDWVTCRMAETTELKGLLDRQVALPLAGLRDIGELIREYGRGKTVFEPSQLLEIADTLSASGTVKKFLKELPDERAANLKLMAERLLDFAPVVDEINRCIEDDKTVRSDASDKLKEIRRSVAGLSAQIGQRFKRIVSSPELRKAIENDKPLTRHGRVVVAIKTRYRQRLRGIVLDRSNTGATLFVEPEALVELSNELEEARFAEQKEIGRILWQLTRTVIEQRKDILFSLKALALFDLTYAKARLSISYQMSAPVISCDSSLSFRRARHPLLQYCASVQRDCPVDAAAEHVVPIDVRLGDDFDLLLVTGPNTGGKTVMIKTIGLLVLMTQSGMHIPAHADSRVGVYRQVFADIGDEQSIEQSLSTFSAHISQIVGILRRTNDKTLVLLDELGAGTDPAEGAVLATAILDKLLTRGAKTVATTHLGRLKSYAYTTPKAENASVQFDSQTFEPTYKLQIGTPGSSNALAIAKQLGMSQSVIRQARSLLQGDADGTSELINQVQATREDAEQKRTQAQETLDDAQQMRAQAAGQLKELKHDRKTLTEQANRQIDKSMTHVRELVDGFTAQMLNAPKPWSEHAHQLAEQISQAAQSTPLAARQSKFTESVRKGDTVYVASFRRNGMVCRIKRKRKVMIVLVEGKEVEVPFTQIWEADSRERH